MTKTDPRWVVVLMSITMLAVSFSLYNQSRLNKNAADDRLAATTRNTVLVDCLSRLAVQITASTASRSKATESRDAAFVASTKALRVVLERRVIQQERTSPEIQAAAAQYVYQTDRFLQESAELNKTREANPPPEFKDFCPKVAGTDVAKGGVR